MSERDRQRRIAELGVGVIVGIVVVLSGSLVSFESGVLIALGIICSQVIEL